MATTLKLKTRPPAKGQKDRAPVRGGTPRPRPTLDQAKADRERQPAAAKPAQRHAVRDPRERSAGGPEHVRPAPPGRAPRDAGRAAPTRARESVARDGRRPSGASHGAQDAPPERIGERAGTRRVQAHPQPQSQPPYERSKPSRASMTAMHDGSLRLSKRMSELGIASRREADEWIPKGWVRVDGRVVSELGSRVLPEQHITIDARARFQQAQRVTVLLHKPVGWVSGQAEDGYEPAIVLVKPQAQWREDHSGIRFLLSHLRHLVPAGRLDIDSTGLLVLTQDGRIARQLIGEDSEVEKEYLVRVEPGSRERLPADSLALLNHGLELDGVALRQAMVEWVNDDQLRFVLREGRKRQIRRMCEAVGLKVTGLKRVRIGNVVLGDLPTGQWRYLRLDERFE